MSAKNAILNAKIQGAIYELMVKTTANQVLLDNDITVADKIAEMVTAINDRAKKADVTTEINTIVNKAINDLIGGAPETYDTLKEIADYISEHAEVVTSINAAIGNKADKTTVATLQQTVTAIQTTVNSLGTLAKKNNISESDLDSTLKTKINGIANNSHNHSNKAVLDGITTANVTNWNGKGKIYYSSAQPTEMTENDLWFNLVE